MMSDALLTETFRTRLRAFIRRRVASDADADDLVQDVLAKLVEHRRTGAGAREEDGGDGRAAAWLYTVARRAIIDRHRSQAAAARRGLPPLPDEPGDEAGAARELSQCLEPMLDALEAGDRELLRRVDMEGQSQAEIARELGISVSTVKSRTQRARAKLLAVLSDCCAIATDARGRPFDYELRKGQSCPRCGPGGGCG